MTLASFGLTQEYKIDLHKTIFTLVTYGKGGWTWNDLYFHIPVFLRNFYLAEMSKAYQQEREAMERNTSKIVKKGEGKTTIEPPVSFPRER